MGVRPPSSSFFIHCVVILTKKSRWASTLMKKLSTETWDFKDSSDGGDQKRLSFREKFIREETSWMNQMRRRKKSSSILRRTKRKSSLTAAQCTKNSDELRDDNKISSIMEEKTARSRQKHRIQSASRNNEGGFYRLRIMKRFSSQKKIKNIDNLGWSALFLSFHFPPLFRAVFAGNISAFLRHKHNTLLHCRIDLWSDDIFCRIVCHRLVCC